MHDLDVFILMDADGNHVASSSDDQETLLELWETHIGGVPVHPTRLLTVKLSVPAPEPVELAAVVPADKLPAVPIELTVA